MDTTLKIISVSQFRTNIYKYLDEVIRGKIIFIKHRGKLIKVIASHKISSNKNKKISP
ncbi:MAG: hypothetical protein HQM15_04985 [Deltaproteobacteria bacterium]|nr:hypothetical protein [Deltaproteobacteria bacterium]